MGGLDFSGLLWCLTHVYVVWEILVLQSSAQAAQSLPSLRAADCDTSDQQCEYISLETLPVRERVGVRDGGVGRSAACGATVGSGVVRVEEPVAELERFELTPYE